MKLLNLDDIALDSHRKVTYKGTSYAVKDFNVEEFIAFQKHFGDFQKRFNSEADGDMLRVVESTQEMVKIGVPEFPHEDISKLNPVQMLALVSMIANILPEPDEETKEVISEKKENGPDQLSLPLAE